MINANKPERWNEDTQASILQYNAWFLEYAPSTYRLARGACIDGAHRFLDDTNYLRSLDEKYLWDNPEDLAIARMFCAPPIARERLAGLAQVSKTIVQSMEKGNMPRGKSSGAQRREAIGHIISVLKELIDIQLCPWLKRGGEAVAYDIADERLMPGMKEEKIPLDREVEIASCVAGDRLCSSRTDPLIRNAQELRQLSKLDEYLDERGYSLVSDPSIQAFDMKPGTYSHHKNVSMYKNAIDAADGMVNTPVDMAIMPFNSDQPVLIECKSAGDATNTNKRRKEEDAKVAQLRGTYGDITLYLFLCGYFESTYLGYEAANHMDWVWEHRINDFDELVPIGK